MSRNFENLMKAENRKKGITRPQLAVIFLVALVVIVLAFIGIVRLSKNFIIKNQPPRKAEGPTQEAVKIEYKKYSGMEEYAKDPAVKKFISKLGSGEDISDSEMAGRCSEFIYAVNHDPEFNSRLKEKIRLSLYRDAFEDLMKLDPNVRAYIEKYGNDEDDIDYEEALRQTSFSEDTADMEARKALSAAKTAVLYQKKYDYSKAAEEAKKIPEGERDVLIWGMAIIDNSSHEVEKNIVRFDKREARQAMAVFIRNLLNRNRSIGEQVNSYSLFGQCSFKYGEQAQDKTISEAFIKIYEDINLELGPFARKNDWAQPVIDLGLLYKQKKDYEKAVKYLHEGLEICKKTNMPVAAINNALEDIYRQQKISSKNSQRGSGKADNKFITLDEYAKDPTTREFLNRGIYTASHEAFSGELEKFADILINDRNFWSGMEKNKPSIELFDQAFKLLSESDPRVKKYIDDCIRKRKVIDYETALKQSTLKKDTKEYVTAAVSVLYMKGLLNDAEETARKLPREEEDMHIFGMVFIDLAADKLQQQRKMEEGTKYLRESASVFIRNITSPERPPGEKLNSCHLLAQCALLSRLTTIDERYKKKYTGIGKKILKTLLPFADELHWTQVFMDYSRLCGEEGNLEDAEKYALKSIESARQECIPMEPSIKSVIEFYKARREFDKAEKYEKMLDNIRAIQAK